MTVVRSSDVQYSYLEVRGIIRDSVAPATVRCQPSLTVSFSLTELSETVTLGSDRQVDHLCHRATWKPRFFLSLSSVTRSTIEIRISISSRPSIQYLCNRCLIQFLLFALHHKLSNTIKEYLFIFLLNFVNIISLFSRIIAGEKTSLS